MSETRNKDKKSYVKFLTVIEAIRRHSDEDNPITVDEIKDYVLCSDFDFTSIDTRLIGKFIGEYNEFCEDDVISFKKDGKKNYYYYNEQVLDIVEARTIYDAIYSSDFLTENTKRRFKERLVNIFNENKHSYFDKTLDPQLVKNASEYVFYQELELIIKAIAEKKEISFIYEKPSLDKQHLKRRVVKPVDTYFLNNEYYLVVERDGNKIKTYRLDYVKDVEIIEDSNVSFDHYQVQGFNNQLKYSTNMYDQGREEVFEIQFHKDVYSNVIDKFGVIKPKKINDTYYKVQVKAILNSTFYGWMIGFEGKVKILSPKQKMKFRTFIDSIY